MKFMVRSVFYPNLYVKATKISETICEVSPHYICCLEMVHFLQKSTNKNYK